MLCSILLFFSFFLFGHFNISHTEWLLGDLTLFSLELGHCFPELCLHDQLPSVISLFPFLVSGKMPC